MEGKEKFDRGYLLVISISWGKQAAKGRERDACVSWRMDERPASFFAAIPLIAVLSGREGGHRRQSRSARLF